jgi:hypothetical protein
MQMWARLGSLLDLATSRFELHITAQNTGAGRRGPTPVVSQSLDESLPCAEGVMSAAAEDVFVP